MMRVSIVAAGKIKEKYLTAGIAEFTKRIAPYAKLDILEIEEEKMPESPSFAQKEKTLDKEAQRLLKLIPPGSYRIVLDVGGKQLSSEQLSEKFAALTLSGHSHITFLIGSAFGLSETLRQAADERVSFSKLTFTHQMIRLLLVEQIYRAFKIWRGEPYHL